jgi:histone-lysine N-methyltransferase SETMAR
LLIKKCTIYIRRRLRNAVRRKSSEKYRTNSWFILYNNTPEHGLILVKDFLANNIVTTLAHPSYSPDLAPAEFYLFRGIQSALQGRRFCDAADVIQNSMKS